MPYFSYTFSTANSSTPGNSPAANLNWIGGKPTSIALSFGGSSTVTNDVKIEYSLDDITRVGGSSLATWMTLNSSLGIGTNSTAVYHLASTTWFDTGFLTQFLCQRHFESDPPGVIAVLPASGKNGGQTFSPSLVFAFAVCGLAMMPARRLSLSR